MQDAQPIKNDAAGEAKSEQNHLAAEVLTEPFVRV